jgi:hypothetical protein
VRPISGASCRHAGTTPARSRPRRRAVRSRRSTEPARPGRRRSASGLGTGRMRVRSASPMQDRAVLPPRLPSPGHRPGRLWQSGPFAHGITAALRRERCGPAVTRQSRAPCGATDPAVTRRLRACNPVVKDQHPGSASSPRARCEPSSGGCRGSRRFTRFDPRRVRRSGVLFRRGVRPTSLWRSWFLRGDRLFCDSHREDPTPPSRPTA